MTQKNGWIIHRHVSGWMNSPDWNDYKYFQCRNDAELFLKKHFRPRGNMDLVGGKMLKLENGTLFEQYHQDDVWHVAQIWGYDDEKDDLDFIELRIEDIEQYLEGE